MFWCCLPSQVIVEPLLPPGLCGSHAVPPPWEMRPQPPLPPRSRTPLWWVHLSGLLPLKTIASLNSFSSFPAWFGSDCAAGWECQATALKAGPFIPPGYRAWCGGRTDGWSFSKVCWLPVVRCLHVALAAASAPRTIWVSVGPLLVFIIIIPSSHRLILAEPCAATMLWDYGQRLKDLEQVSKTLMPLGRYLSVYLYSV